jgi:hypothetical protein
VNLFDGSTYKIQSLVNNSDGGITIPILPIAWYLPGSYLQLKPKTQYQIYVKYGVYGRFALTTKRGIPDTLLPSQILNYATINGTTLFTTDATGLLYIEYCTDAEHASARDATIYIQISEGNTVPPAYEPYKSSVSYTPAIGSSLPNGVSDTDDVVSGVKTKNVGIFKIDQNITWNSATADPAPNDPDYYLRRVDGWQAAHNAVSINYAGIGYCADGNFNVRTDVQWTMGRNIIIKSALYVKIEKAKIDAQTGATLVEKWNNYLTAYPITLHYQLATPVVEQYPPQAITSFNSGTVIVSPRIQFVAKPVSGVITVPVDKQKWPIKSIVSVKKIVNGVPSEDATVASNTATTIALTGGVDTESYEVIYDYPPESTTVPTVSESHAMNVKAQVESSADAINNLSETLWDFILSQV